MALKIIDHGSPEYQQMVQLRNDILRKPLGLSFVPEELEKEKDEKLLAPYPGLASYRDRCLARPAWKRTIEAYCARVEAG